MSVRRRRTDLAPQVVAVTGSGAGLGRALAARLAGGGDLVVRGLDVVPSDLPGVDERPGDVRGADLVRRLEGAATVVHLSVSFDAGEDAAARSDLNVRGTSLLLAAAREAGVRRVVLVTSAAVHGARPGNPVPLPEDAPLLARPDEGTLVADHLEVERLADHAGRTGLDVVVLRPATLVGGPLGPGYDGQRLRRLGGTRLLATRGHEPLWQLCHSDDLLSALELAARGAVSGQRAVASAGWLEQWRVEALSGRRRLELPPAVALSTAERLHRYGVTASSREELADVLAPLVVDPAGLRGAGWVPEWTTEEALLEHLRDHEPEGSRAAVVAGVAGAATGASVAVVGAAALVRRARRRRRRL